MGIVNLITNVLGFLWTLVVVFISTGIVAFIMKSYKLGTGVILLFFSSSVGYVFVQAGGSVKGFIVLLVFTFWPIWYSYKFYKTILKLKVDYGNTNIQNRTINIVSLFIHMALLEVGLVFFNIKDYDSNNSAMIIVAIFVLYIAEYILEGFDEFILEVEDRVSDGKFITKEQLVKDYGAEICKYKRGYIDLDFDAFELLEAIGCKYTNYIFIAKRNSNEVAICMEEEFYDSTFDYIESLAETKKIVYAYDVIQTLNKENNINLDIATLKNFINLKHNKVFCFGDAIISSQQVEVIRKNINADLNSGSFDIAKVQQKYGIDVNSITELANYFGVNVRIV